MSSKWKCFCVETQSGQKPGKAMLLPTKMFISKVQISLKVQMLGLLRGRGGLMGGGCMGWKGLRLRRMREATKCQMIREAEASCSGVVTFQSAKHKIAQSIKFR